MVNKGYFLQVEAAYISLGILYPPLFISPIIAQC